MNAKFAALIVSGIAAGAAFAGGKTILDIQPHATSNDLTGLDAEGKSISATFINLNPGINSWFVLKAIQSPSKNTRHFHIENANPKLTSVALIKSDRLGFELVKGDAKFFCPLSVDQFTASLEKAVKLNDAFAPICNGMLYLRIAITGRQSSKEAVASFLRKHVWGGEAITTMVKETLYQDKFMLESGGTGVENSQFATMDHEWGPEKGSIDSLSQGKLISTVEFGIPTQEKTDEGMVVGRWYKSAVDDAVFVSAIDGSSVSKEILATYPDRVSPLDDVEKKAISYLVAFDVDRYEFGFTIGTESPGVEWSNRVMSEFVRTQPGPDGFDSIFPLVGTGKVRPNIIDKIAATFTGGFKRGHGAFRHGDFAAVNNGSHYGFMESGTIFSSLQPGLATVLIDRDGRISLKTWEEQDNKFILPTTAHARQNGVAIIESSGVDSQIGIPGKLVSKWGPGNWSGSIDSRERALRAGVCMTNRGGKSYLIYGYFSTATPSAMARVFQAYHCTYALHLDMNALEHTYLALYSVEGQKLQISNLIKGMSVLDQYHDNNVSPRFLGLSDNRDFFYLQRRDVVPEPKPTDPPSPPPTLSPPLEKDPGDGLPEKVPTGITAPVPNAQFRADPTQSPETAPEAKTGNRQLREQDGFK
jgi:hypothetical protein